MKPRKFIALLATVAVAGLGTVSGSAASATTTVDQAVGKSQQAYPNAPTDLHIADSSQQTSLTASWGAVSGASGYRVGRNGVALTDTAQTSYTWTGLTCGTRYTLSVQPETSSRDTSGHFATVSGTTASCPTSGATSVGGAQSSGTISNQPASASGQRAYPDAPTDLRITDSSQQTSLKAAWTAVTGASGYRVGRNGVALTDTAQTSYTWTGLTCGTRYTLSVQPETSSRDTSGHFATVSGTTASCPTSGATSVGGAQSSGTISNQPASASGQRAYPDAPTDLRITDSSQQTSLKAAWTAVTGASGYRVGRNGVARTDTAQTSYTWTGLTCGTRYTLSVQPETSSRDTSGHFATVSAATASCPTSSATASGSVAFEGDFPNGSVSRWLSTPSVGGAQCLNYGLVSDAFADRGQVHVVTDSAAKGGYDARFDLPAADKKYTACELLRGRTIAMDDEWYALEIRFPGNWQEPSPAGWGMSVAQFNYERIWGAPLGVVAHSETVKLILQSGLCVPVTSPNPHCQYSSGTGGNVPGQDIIPSSVFLAGAWHELLVHVKWTTGDDGLVEGYHRIRGQAAWTRTVRFAGYPTLQRTSTFTPRATDITVDKIGAYRGPSTLPLSVWHRNFCQATSRVAAESCLA